MNTTAYLNIEYDYKFNGTYNNFDFNLLNQLHDVSFHE